MMSAIDPLFRLIVARTVSHPSGITAGPARIGSGAAKAVIRAGAGECGEMTTEMPVAVAVESAEGKAGRYERALRAIGECPLLGTEFADWVQSACDDVLEDYEAECWNCGTSVHEGPCAEDEPVAEGRGQEASRG